MKDRRISRRAINPNKYHVVHNGIIDSNEDFDDVPSETLGLIMKFTENQFTAVTICRLSQEKNISSILEALEMLRNIDVKINLVIIGEGPLMESLKQETIMRGLEQQVLFTGYIERAGRLLTLFNAYIISSFTEGLPITLLEAMRSGLPVIATSVGGIPEVISDGESGLLIEAGDSKKLSDAVKQISTDSKLSRRLGRNARATFCQSFTSRVMEKAYRDVYSKVLKLA